jgi:uncharacterized membrane protein YphA (DoxX/SURF4 family)
MCRRMSSNEAMAFHETAAVVGQALIGLFFVIAGVNQFFNLGQMKAYAAAKRVPAVGIVIPIVALALAVGGVAILADPFVGVELLTVGVVIGVASTLVITFVMHDFWRMAPQDDHLMSVEGTEGEAKVLPPQDNEIFHFLKNLALIGGILLLLQ